MSVTVPPGAIRVVAAGARCGGEVERKMGDKGRQIMFVVDGGISDAFMQVGDVADLAERLRYAHYSGDVDVTGVYALDQLNELKPVVWKIDGAHDYDEDSMAYPVLTVTFPDGGTEQAIYQIDGAS